MVSGLAAYAMKSCSMKRKSLVCSHPQCGEWTRLAFGYEEVGPLAPHLRMQNDRIRRFEELNEVEQYGTNW